MDRSTPVPAKPAATAEVCDEPLSQQPHHSAPDRRRERGRRTLRGLSLLCGLAVLSGWAAAQTTTSGSAAGPAAAIVQPEESRMWMTVGQRRFAITPADTDAARAFASMLPLSIEMDDLNGNEKKADLRQPLPARASQPGTIHSGDLMLYGSRTLVVFYVTFESAYSYTRLGRVDDPAGLAEALGSGSVRIEFSSRPAARP
jgi:hypothetical protein